MMCGMKVTHSVRYDAPPADVYAMLTDPTFREKASWAQDADSVTVEVDGGTVRIVMSQPNTDVPSFAKAFAGATTTVHQSEDWRDGVEADFTTDTPGKPVSIRGTRRLVADGDGTLDTFEGEAKARVPLIGGKIEKLVAEKLKDGWDTEAGLGARWLKGER